MQASEPRIRICNCKYQRCPLDSVGHKLTYILYFSEINFGKNQAKTITNFHD